MSMEFKHIVRLAGSDLDGTKNVAYALTRIKGINIRLANAMMKKTDISPEKRLGFLSEVEIGKIEKIVKNLGDIGLPVWLLNRRKDFDTGRDIHLITSDLDLQTKADIEQMKSMKSWRGYRHAYGLKVRGQRTKATGRKGKSTSVRKRRGGTLGRS